MQPYGLWLTLQHQLLHSSSRLSTSPCTESVFSLRLCPFHPYSRGSLRPCSRAAWACVVLFPRGVPSYVSSFFCVLACSVVALTRDRTFIHAALGYITGPLKGAVPSHMSVNWPGFRSHALVWCTTSDRQWIKTVSFQLNRGGSQATGCISTDGLVFSWRRMTKSAYIPASGEFDSDSSVSWMIPCYHFFRRR